MSQKRYIVTQLWDEFKKRFLPKLNKLSVAERLVLARFLIKELEKYIEENEK